MTEEPSPTDPLLSSEERDLLVRFFRRALDLYGRGAVTAESVLDYLRVVVDALDPEHPGSLASVRGALEDAWREADG